MQAGAREGDKHGSGGNKWGKWGWAEMTNRYWGKSYPCLFLLLIFQSSNNLVPTSHISMQKADEEGEHVG